MLIGEIKPKVSIVIPCYNAEKWIKQSVESALKQTYLNIEVIFVDNESTDKSVEIVQEIHDAPDATGFEMSSAENIYPNCWDEARAEGFRLATGEYLFTLAADDYIDSNFIDNCMQYILAAKTKNVDILAFQSPILGLQGDSNLITGVINHNYPTSDLLFFKSLCLQKCPVTTPSVIFHRSLYENDMLETYPEKYGGAADYDLYCRLADNNVAIYPADRWLGYHYRWHEDQATWRVHEEKKEKDYDKMIQEYWKEEWEL